MDGFIPKSPEIHKYFYNELTKIKNTHLYETQQQDPVTTKHPPLLH